MSSSSISRESNTRVFFLAIFFFFFHVILAEGGHKRSPPGKRLLLPDPTKPENRELCFPQGTKEEHDTFRVARGENPDPALALREGAVLCDVDGALSRQAVSVERKARVSFRLPRR